MMAHLRRFGAAAFVAVFVSTCAFATTLKRMSVAELVSSAQVIVRARCVSNSVRWDAGEIWTFTAFDVQETWKGSAPARITVRLLGGNTGALTSTVSGVPRFAEGEQIVLFLERTAPGEFSVVSWVQGTFRIRPDRASGEETVTQDSASFAVLDPASHHFEAFGVRRMALGAFRELVAASIGNGVGRRP